MHPYHLSLFLSCALHARDPSKAPAPSSLKPRRYGKQRLPITQLARHVPAGPSGVAVSPPQTFLWPLVVSVTSSAACAGRKMGIAIGPVTAPLPSPVACCRPRPPWKTPSRMVQNKLTRARTDECRTKANRLYHHRKCGKSPECARMVASPSISQEERHCLRETASKDASCKLLFAELAFGSVSPRKLLPSPLLLLTYHLCKLLLAEFSLVQLGGAQVLATNPSAELLETTPFRWILELSPRPTKKRSVTIPSRSGSTGDLPLPTA